jgi:Ca2+-binding RTX toxin-like protein
MNSDGTNARRLLAFGRSPAWSPDGSRLSLIRALPSHPGVLWVVNADGTDAHQVWRGAGAVVRSHAWSPDGKAILFVASGRPGDVRAHYVYAVGPDGREPPRVFFEAPPGTFPGPLSPDGSMIVLRETGPGGVGTMSLADRSYRRLLEHSSDPASALLSEVVWAPNGLELAYTEVGRSPDPGSFFPRADLFRLELASGQTTRVGAVGAGGVDWQARCTHGGSAGPDLLRGTRSADLVCGLGGNDRVAGGAGNDRLFGEQGDDLIDSRDRGFDVVGCGPGRDTALADAGDLVGVDCERVRRSR